MRKRTGNRLTDVVGRSISGRAPLHAYVHWAGCHHGLLGKTHGKRSSGKFVPHRQMGSRHMSRFPCRLRTVRRVANNEPRAQGGGDHDVAAGRRIRNAGPGPAAGKRCSARLGHLAGRAAALRRAAAWRRGLITVAAGWRVKERSTSPDSVFQIPGFGVPHQRNTQEAHSGPTTRYTLASPRGTMPSCAARGAVPTRVCPCGGTRSPAHLAPYPSSACRGESYLRWSSPVGGNTTHGRRTWTRARGVPTESVGS